MQTDKPVAYTADLQLFFPAMTAISPFPTMLYKVEVQQLLDISDRTLEKMVRARKFPPSLQLGKNARWAETVVLRWLEARLEAQMTWQPPKRSTRTAQGAAKA